MVTEPANTILLSDLREGSFSCSINRGALYQCTPEWRFDTGAFGWKDQDLWLVLDGELLLTSPATAIRARRGDALILTDCEQYRGTILNDSPPTLVAIHFDIARGGCRRFAHVHHITEQVYSVQAD